MLLFYRMFRFVLLLNNFVFELLDSLKCFAFKLFDRFEFELFESFRFAFELCDRFAFELFDRFAFELCDRFEFELFESFTFELLFEYKWMNYILGGLIILDIY